MPTGSRIEHIEFLERLRMKKLFGIILLLIFINTTNSLSQNSSQINLKDLVGIWQSDTPKEGNAWLDVYRFFSDGTFIYNFSRTNDTRRINNLHGRFRLKGNVLYTIIDLRTERTGGRVERGGFGSEQEWVLVGDTIAVINQEQSVEEAWPIKLCDSSSAEIKCINLRHDYYLVRKDPNDY